MLSTTFSSTILRARTVTVPVPWLITLLCLATTATVFANQATAAEATVSGLRGDTFTLSTPTGPRSISAPRDSSELLSGLRGVSVLRQAVKSDVPERSTRAVDFDQPVTPEVIFGSGNSNGSFTVDRRNGIEVGLRAKLRYDANGNPQNVFRSNGDGSYTYFTRSRPDFPDGQRGEWAFEWSVNTDFDDSTGDNLAAYSYEIGLDADAGQSTDFLTFDPITPSLAAPSFDHAIGNNSTGNGEGLVAINETVYEALIADNNLAQNSWQYGFFLNGPLANYNPRVEGTYTIYLQVNDAIGDAVARAEINVIVVDPELEFDQNATPDIINGSGNANGALTTDRRNDIEIALRGKLRFNGSGQPENTFNSNGDGSYAFQPGIAPGQSFPTAEWAFDWSVNTNFNGGDGPDLSQYTYEIGLDGNPGLGTDFLTFDPIIPGAAPFFDHAIGDNTTANGAGTVASNAVDYSNLIDNNNVAQNSWRYDFFDEPGTPLEGFDPTVPGRYTIYIQAMDGATVVARSQIDIVVGAGPADLLVESVAETGDVPDAIDNDYTRINNIIQAATSGSRITLRGVFDWSEINAATSWSMGSDATAATGDDFSITYPAGLNNLTLTAATLGEAVILGPGDLPGQDLEAFIVVLSPDNRGLEFSNLRIEGFDLSIGMFFSGGPVSAYDNTRIVGNHIVMPTDLAGIGLAGEAFQNIGIHFAFGNDQLIANNVIEIPGDGSSTNLLRSTDVAMQSNTSSGAYEGLIIENNEVRILNAPTANPQTVLGIWENSNAFERNIIVRNNRFINMDPNNDPALNRQAGFRITAQSSATTANGSVWSGNLVDGANVGFEWLPGRFGADWSSRGPLEFVANSARNNSVGIRLDSNGSANFKCNLISGNSVAGIENVNDDPMVLSDASVNWWGCNDGPGTGSCDAIDSAAVAGSNWLLLELAASPNAIATGETSALTASLLNTVNGDDSPSLAGCTVPDGTDVSFNGGALGATTPATDELLSGLAGSTFTGLVPGVANDVSASLGAETVSTTILIDTVTGGDAVYVDSAYAGSVFGESLNFTLPDSTVVNVNFGVDAFADIQAAVDAVNVGGTVRVAAADLLDLPAGLPLEINTSGILLTTDPADPATLRYGFTDFFPVIEVFAEDSTIENFVIVRENSAAAAQGVAIRKAGTVLRNLEVIGSNNANIAGITLDHGLPGEGYADMVDNVLVENNRISGSFVWGFGVATRSTNGAITGAIIQNNVLDGVSNGIFYFDNGDAMNTGISNVAYTGNLHENLTGTLQLFQSFEVLVPDAFVAANTLDRAVTASGQLNVWLPIQSAVDAADPGATVRAKAATYPEAVTIDKADLVLVGAGSGQPVAVRVAGGPDETVIDAPMGAQHAIDIAVDGVTIDGMSITSTAGAVRGIGETTAVAGSLVQNNFVYGFTASIGINLAAGSSDATVQGNDITDVYAGIYLSSNTTNHVISANAVRDLAGGAGPDQGSGIVFEGNNTGISIAGNELSNNAFGVYLFNLLSDLSGTSLRDNLITGGAGIVSTNVGQLDAACNWWGDASGPSGDASGSGSSVSGSVVFQPWNTSPVGPCDGGPELLPADGTLAFGDVLINTSMTRTLTLTAAGDASASLGQAVITGMNMGHYTIVNDACSNAVLMLGNSCDIEIQFMPASVGGFSASLEIPSDAVGNPTVVALTGTGVDAAIAATPTALVFSDTVVTTDGFGDVLLSNTGAGTLNVTNLDLTGADASEFSIDAQDCIGAPITPGGFCTVTVRFSPITVATFTASLDVTSNAASGLLQVPLSGDGVANAADLAISIVPTVPFAAIDDTLTYIVLVTNNGPADVTAASVSSTLDSDLDAVTWSCTPDAGAVCAASGSGDVSDSVDLSSGTSVMYVVEATVLDGGPDETVTSSATVLEPMSPADPVPGNNTDQVTTQTGVFADGFEGLVEL